MLLSTFSRKGGLATSAAKTAANRLKAAAYWKEVREGARTAPRRRCSPPKAEDLARLLIPFCRQHGIVKLEVFGSVARGEARRGSDVDLIATFKVNPGLQFFSMSDDLASILGVPVDLLTNETVAGMTNLFRKQTIDRDRKLVYAA
jgi:predicted nucleotidyltransferase